MNLKLLFPVTLLSYVSFLERWAGVIGALRRPGFIFKTVSYTQAVTLVTSSYLDN